MIENSQVICDSNICIYRTLAIIEPKIYNQPVIFTALKHINDITNEGMACKIFITDTIKDELINRASNSFILIKTIKDFCIKKLHWAPNDYKIQKLIRNAEKSLNKFITKYHILKHIPDFSIDHTQHIPHIDQFYLQYPEKLKQITESKTKFLGSQNEIQAKLNKRPNDLPEEPDRKILAEANHLKKRDESTNCCILSNDSDFTEFSTEIEDKFKVKIEQLPAD